MQKNNAVAEKYSVSLDECYENISENLPLTMCIVGPPFAGKGINSSRVRVLFSGGIFAKKSDGVCLINTGQLLRNYANSPRMSKKISRAILSRMKDGDPVPNAYKAFLWFREIEAQLSQVENLSIVFDGSPIDEEEAKLILDSLYPIDRKLFVIELVLPESQIKKRFTKARRSNRIDANWPIIKKRLDVYDKQTKYGALIALKTLGIVVEEVDCSDKKEDQVFEQIIRSIDYAIRKG